MSDGGASKEVTGYSGGGILIKCKYDTDYKDKQKHFCKDSKSGCSEQIKTGDKNQWVNSGRFSLFDDTKSSEFWVMIRELTVQDTGTYQCGVNRTLDIDIYTPVELKVKQGSLVSREVTAYAGGRINIKCRHEDEYKDKSKTFCKIGTHQWCFNQKQTKPNSEWSHDGRFSIHDNRSAGFFSVFIRELNIEDTGTYACGGVVFGKLEIYTVVTLNVTEDLSYEKSISKTLHVGGDLTVRCKYPQSLRSDPKFLCRGRTQDFACSYKDSVKESRKNVTIGGKFSLYDDREKQIFTVSIRAVTKQDSEYWCGAEKAWTSDHGYRVYFTRINLKVTGFPASTVISVSVILLLLLIGTIILTVALQKNCSMQAAAASVGKHCDQESGNDQRISLQCDYEEMKYAESLIYTTVIFYSNAINDAAPIVNDEVLYDYTSVTYSAVCG
ncbi:hypothetical protein Q7C36_006147 [Tachysurus vachellii]|uniref:Ig-like domain-containing protein n=1 Tax=Tachysurus vachellii TaxID=175792 RepID=A0AA88NLR7_TACVA|nr:hypothetical protein Q7C36_006147 [Tachysurus vachellii]